METESIRNPARADGDLLRAFVERSDGPAFTALVTRHGPLVLGVCRRVLSDAPEADDAFQATFLILARKAGSVRTPERLGSWLYGVALRCAYQARKASRRAQEQPMPDLPAKDQPDPEWTEVRSVLDAEIGRLPDKLRAALVLCELQGLDRAAAAERLGVPVGTLSSRLSRAKDALRRRLVRRGITLSLVGLGMVLTQAAATAAVPPPLALETTGAANAFAAGKGVGSPAVIASQVMRAATVKVVGTTVVVGVMVLALAGAFWALFAPSPVIDDREAIQGTWKVLAARSGDKDTDMFGQTVTVDGTRFHFHFPDSQFDASYRLDPTQTPKAIDIDVPFDEKTAVLKGVYEFVEEGRLHLHLAPPGQPRPRSTRMALGPEVIVLYLGRVND